MVKKGKGINVKHAEHMRIRWAYDPGIYIIEIYGCPSADFSG